MTSGEHDPNARFRAEVERVQASGILGRSDSLNRLYRYLAERSGAPNPPREIDIALDVFDRVDASDVSQDASIRVYIHRLRAKLDSFYGKAPAGGDRLALPRGEYRLVLLPGAESQAIETPTPAAVPPIEMPTQAAVPPIDEPVQTDATPIRLPSRTRRRVIANGLVLLLVAACLTFGYLVGRGTNPARSDMATTPIWSPILRSTRPAFIVLGDYYIFGEREDTQDVQKLVRKVSINSPAELDLYVMNHPHESARYVDLGLHYLPLSIAPALGNVLPAIANAQRDGLTRPEVTTMSQLAPDTMKGSNIVYIGYLSGLGLIRDLLFRVSSFGVGANYDEVIDHRTGKHYRSNWASSAAIGRPYLDYAYLASFSGAGGNRIVVISGTQDAGVRQASEAATNATLLDGLSRSAGSNSFEALYEVSTLGRVNVGSRLIAVRPLSASATSPAGGFGRQHFPGE